MTTSEQQTTAIHQHVEQELRRARSEPRAAAWFGATMVLVAVALLAVGVAKVAINADILIRSGPAMLSCLLLLAVMAFGMTQTVLISVRGRRDSLRRAAHTIIGLRRYQRTATAILHEAAA